MNGARAFNENNAYTHYLALSIVINKCLLLKLCNRSLVMHLPPLPSLCCVYDLQLFLIVGL